MSSKDTGFSQRRGSDPPEMSGSWFNVLQAHLPQNNKLSNRVVSEQPQRSSSISDLASASDSSSPKSNAKFTKDSASPKSNANSAKDSDSPKSRTSDSTSSTGSDLFGLPTVLSKQKAGWQKERDEARKDLSKAEAEAAMLRQRVRVWRRRALTVGGIVVFSVGAAAGAVIGGWVVVDVGSLTVAVREMFSAASDSAVEVIARLQ